MTQPAPKFDVGQRVMVRAPALLEFHVDDGLITDARYFYLQPFQDAYGRIDIVTGWAYMLDTPDGNWALEESLRPRPEPGKLTFDELMKSVSQDTVNANLFEDVGGLVAPESEWCKQARSVFSEIERKVLNTRDISSNG